MYRISCRFCGNRKVFLYNEEDATFLPYTEIQISDSTSIILLSDTGDVSLPSSYQQGELTVGDQSYPYWADPENDRYDLMYALNTRTGEKDFISMIHQMELIRRLRHRQSR